MQNISHNTPTFENRSWIRAFFIREIFKITPINYAGFEPKTLTSEISLFLFFFENFWWRSLLPRPPDRKAHYARFGGLPPSSVACQETAIALRALRSIRNLNQKIKNLLITHKDFEQKNPIFQKKIADYP